MPHAPARERVRQIYGPADAIGGPAHKDPVSRGSRVYVMVRARPGKKTHDVMGRPISVGL